MPLQTGGWKYGTCTIGPWILKTTNWGLCFARKHAMLVTFGTRTRDGWQGCCPPEQFFRARRDRLKSWKSPHFNWFNDLYSYNLSGLHDGQLRMISDASNFSWAGCEMCSSIFASWLCRNAQWNPNDRKIPKASEWWVASWDHFGVHEADESTTCSGTRRFGSDLCRFSGSGGQGEGRSQEVLKEFERHWSGDLAVVRSCSNLAIGFRGMKDRAEKYSSEVQILSTSPWTLDDPYRNQLKLECLNVISTYDIICAYMGMVSRFRRHRFDNFCILL